MSRMYRECAQQMRTTQTILFRKIKRKRSFGSYKGAWKNDVHIYLKEISSEAGTGFCLLQTLPSCCRRTSSSMECGEVLE
jgi:hypothetical protein